MLLASNGSSLHQLNNKNNLEIIAYNSGVFSKSDQRLGCRHRELLALTYGIKHQEYYLLGAKFTCVIDHHSLVFLLQEKSRQKLPLKIINCINYLYNFDFKILHRAGNHEWLITPDCLSRSISLEDIKKYHNNEVEIIPDKIFSMLCMPKIFAISENPKLKYFLRSAVRGKNNSDEEILEQKIENILDFGIHSYSLKDIFENQQNDKSIKNIFQKIRMKPKRTVKNYEIRNKILYRKGHGRFSTRLVLPQNISKHLIEFVHISMVHPGYQRINAIICKHFFIPIFGKICNKILKSCITCVQVKPRPAIKPRPIIMRNFENVPWEKCHVDLWDAGRNDVKGTRYLVCITDELTGYTDGECLSSKSEKLVVEALLKIIFRNGIINSCIISDNGSELAGIWDKVVKSLNIVHIRTSAYYSPSNGRIERIFKELNVRLKLLKTDIKHWSIYWPYVCFIINNSPRLPLVDLTPAEAMFSRNLYLPYKINNNVELPKTDFLTGLSSFINELHQNLMELHYQRHYKLYGTKLNPKILDLEIGSKVLMWRPTVANGKLSVQYV